MNTAKSLLTGKTQLFRERTGNRVMQADADIQHSISSLFQHFSVDPDTCRDHFCQEKEDRTLGFLPDPPVSCFRADQVPVGIHI